MRYLPLALLACLGCPSHPSPVDHTASATAISAASVAPSGAPREAASSAPMEAASTAPSDAPVVGTPAWIAAAARAPAPFADAFAHARAQGSPFRHDDKIDPVLDRVASQAPTATGLRAAAKILDENQGAGGDMSWAGSGMSPAARLMHAAGMALLADLLTRACAATPKDADVGPAVETIPLPPVFSSVRDRAATDRDREMLRVAGAGCGLKSTAGRL